MEKLLISNARILDVRTGKVLEKQYILVSDGLIEDITYNKPDLADIETLDVEGYFVVPGFIDAHVHVNAVTADLSSLRVSPPSYITPQAMKIMGEMLMRGFTTVRDAAGADWGIAKAVEQGFIISPRIIFGGQALSPTGGHGDGRTAGDNTGHNHNGTDLSILCDGVDEVRKASRNLIRTGAHHIKIMASGGVASPTDRIDSLQFSEEEICAIVGEARAANIYVLAHAYTAKAVNRALKLGVRSIEHANLLDDESIELFKKHDAFLVPTLVTYYALKEEGLELGLPKDSYAKIATVLETGKEAIKRAYDGGVKLVYGSDLLGYMQRRQLEEFSLLAKLIPPIDALRSATITAAELLKLEGKVGEIVSGAFADLIVMKANPLEDMNVLQNPEANLLLIMKGGKIYKNKLYPKN